jgi:hypothetical protein
MSFTVTITENKPTNVAELETTSEVFRQTSARPASGVQRSEQETAQASRAEAGAEGCRAVSDWRSRPRKPRPDMVANNPAIVKHGRAARLPGNHIYRSWESMKGRSLRGGHGTAAGWNFARPHRQQQRLLAEQLPLGNAYTAIEQPAL